MLGRAAQAATGVAPPFEKGLDLRSIEPVAAWIEAYADFIKTVANALITHTLIASVSLDPIIAEIRPGMPITSCRFSPPSRYNAIYVLSTEYSEIGTI